MFLYLIVIVLAFFIYRFAADLLQYEGAWKLPQYGELILLILSVPLLVFSIIRAVKQFKIDREKLAEDEKKRQAEIRERTKRFYLEDDDAPAKQDLPDDEYDDEDYDDDDDGVTEVDDNIQQPEQLPGTEVRNTSIYLDDDDVPDSDEYSFEDEDDTPYSKQIDDMYTQTES